PNRPAPAPPAPAPPAAPAAPPAPAALPPRHLPLLTLKKLDVGIERLSFKDARSQEGKLLAASVRLTNREPIEALGEDVESNRPVLLDMEGKLEPFVRAFGVALETSPFAKEPELKVDMKS